MERIGKVILEVKDLKTWFFTRQGIVKAVDGVSFSLREREIVGLVGESGCGKTICCRSILRLVPEPAGRIVGGEILLEGQDILQASESEIMRIRGKKISMIFQDPNISLNPLFTVGEQVAEPLRIHGKVSRRNVWAEVVKTLAKVNIPSPEVRMREYPHQMSGGMKQRIVGSVAISCYPRVLIADEPTTSLDVTTQDQYLRLLEDIQHKINMGIIFVTHDLSITASICDYVNVFYAGRIVESGPVRDIFYNSCHPYTIALMKCLPHWERDVERLSPIGGEPPSLLNPPEGCRFLPRCDMASHKCEEACPTQVMVGKDHWVSCWNKV